MFGLRFNEHLGQTHVINLNEAPIQWVRKEDMIVSLQGMHAEIFGDQLYSFGGYSSGGGNSGIYKLNIIPGTWETLSGVTMPSYGEYTGTSIGTTGNMWLMRTSTRAISVFDANNEQLLTENIPTPLEGTYQWGPTPTH